MSVPPAIVGTSSLGFVGETRDPFLFCVHHDDAYPKGNDVLGPDASLGGRDIGQDFAGRDGWRMYHGTIVPGFPQHPHRGFETITVVRRGFVDHCDSLGAAGRYGEGDVQWMTAGRGIVHSEMFPLLRRDGPNPTELFQIWINLPAKNKFVKPHFSMFWSHELPRHTFLDGEGRSVELCRVAGRLEGFDDPPAPPPSSWAAVSEAHVAVWTLKFAPHARWRLPSAPAGVHRTLYFFAGVRMRFDDRDLSPRRGVDLRAESPVMLENGPAEAELLLLQGRPIREPVAQHGPFVMNTRAELVQAYEDYRRTGFGGWPWPNDAPTHPRDRGRFARDDEGNETRPSSGSAPSGRPRVG